jgi:hypothetical protein
MGVTGSMRRQSIDSEMRIEPRLALENWVPPSKGNKHSVCTAGDSVGVGISQYGAIDPARTGDPTSRNYFVRENNMHESSTITITEYRLSANGTVELLSDRPKSECGHPQLKSFKFSNGQTIRMCPNCTKFDEHRRAVLGGTKRKSKMENCVPTFSEECVLTIEGGSYD